MAGLAHRGAPIELPALLGALGTQRALFAVADDRFDLGRRSTFGLEIGGNSLGPPLAEILIVCDRSALVGVADDGHALRIVLAQAFGRAVEQRLLAVVELIGVEREVDLDRRAPDLRRFGARRRRRGD